MTPKTVLLSKHIKQRPGAVEHRAFYLRIRDAPLLVCNVSIARMQFFHHGFLMQLHSTSILKLCLRGKTPVRSLPFIGGGESIVVLSHGIAVP